MTDCVWLQLPLLEKTRSPRENWREAQKDAATVCANSYGLTIESETYATADVIAYDGQSRVKVGREFLFPD
jgi:hypothetical protein